MFNKVSDPSNSGSGTTDSIKRLKLFDQSVKTGEAVGADIKKLVEIEERREAFNKKLQALQSHASAMKDLWEMEKEDYDAKTGYREALNALKEFTKNCL